MATNLKTLPKLHKSLLALTFGLLLVVVVPFATLVAIVRFGYILSADTYLQYQGISAMLDGSEIYKLYITPSQVGGLYLKVGEESKEWKEVKEEDLLSLGFKKERFGFIKKVRPIYSSADLDENGNLSALMLVHLENARVAFSSSPDGPFLELPVSRKEFEKQFGRATGQRHEYNYNDPR